MGFEQIIFWLLALATIGCASMVVLPPGGRNPLYGALLLVVSFFFISGLYVMLFAHTMAILQILVYAGAIMVLFMFVIMFLNLGQRDLGTESRTLAKGVGLAAAIAVGVQLVLMVERQSVNLTAQPISEDFGSVGSIADLMITDYLIPFELTGILLLVAVIGAVVLAKRSLSS